MTEGPEGADTLDASNAGEELIPIAIFLGLIGGLIPRYRWWSVPATGVIWSVMLAVGGDPNMSLTQIWIGGFFLGAANGAVGVMASWLVVTVIGRLRVP